MTVFVDADRHFAESFIKLIQCSLEERSEEGSRE